LANKKNYKVGRALLTLYITTGKTEQAEELLAILESEYSLDQALLLSKSRLQTQLKQSAQAKKTLKILFGLIYEQANKLVVLAHAQLDLNDVSAANKTIERIKHLEAQTLRPYLQARLYFAKQEYALAEKLINENVRDISTNTANTIQDVSWLALKAHLLIAKQEFAVATTIIEKLYQQDKQRKYLQVLAQLYAQQDQEGLLINLLSSWLKIMPNDEWAVAQLSALAMSQEDISLAIKVLEDYPKLSKQPAFLNNLANYYLKEYLKHNNNSTSTSYKNKALDYAKQAYMLAPHVAAINDTLGWIYIRLGLIEQGLGLLREASARDSNNGEIYYHLAYALAELNNKKQAEIALAKAIKLSAEHPLRVVIRKKLQ